MRRITANQLAQLAALQRDREELMPLLRVLRMQPGSPCALVTEGDRHAIKITGSEAVTVLEARKARIDDALRELGLEVAGE